MDHVMAQVSFAFDILITVLLGATIYFAVKLSRHLDTFRSNRSDMETLIRELSSQITRAQEGISVLDDLSTTRGDELRGLLGKAQGYIDELHVMTESGNSLAERLETMAVRNRELIEEMDEKALGLVYPGTKTSSAAPVPPLTATRPPKYEETLTRAKAEKAGAEKARAEKARAEKAAPEPMFMIRDPDFDAEDAARDDIDDIDDRDDDFTSQAERDLAEALKRRIPKGT